jgi:hypothetical protein
MEEGGRRKEQRTPPRRKGALDPPCAFPFENGQGNLFAIKYRRLYKYNEIF